MVMHWIQAKTNPPQPLGPRPRCVFLRSALGGLVTGFLIMLYPTYGLAGVGYEGVNAALLGKFSLLLLLTLGALKIIATSFTIGSGASGGIFAPSLYIGWMFGGAMRLLFNWAFPSGVHQPFTYALAGMAALFAGAARAPINVIIMIPEMSHDFALIPPMPGVCHTPSRLCLLRIVETANDAEHDKTRGDPRMPPPS